MNERNLFSNPLMQQYLGRVLIDSLCLWMEQDLGLAALYSLLAAVNSILILVYYLSLP